MKIIPCYKNKIISLPAETVLPELSTATREELAVLIAITASPEFDVSELSAKLNITESTLISAVSTWTRKGAVSVLESTENHTAGEKKSISKDNTEEKKTPVIISAAAKASVEKASIENTPDIAVQPAINNNVKKVSALRTTSLPHYSTDETASYLERNPSFTSLLDSCQMILGKVFNTAEATIIIGMVDHLSLSPEYIMLLFAHAKNMGKDSIRYIEKMALSLFDRGILTYAELIEEVSAKEAAAEMETYVRKLFGLGRRALIDSEREMIDRWTNEFKMSREMISKAYEITVSKTNEASFPYMNAIIENWHKAGYGTVDEVLSAEEAYKRDKESKDASRSSFTTDEFYEAALKRSYENMSNG